MQSVSQHYEDLLCRHDTWMLGDDTKALARGQRELSERIAIAAPAPTARAIQWLSTSAAALVPSRSHSVTW